MADLIVTSLVQFKAPDDESLPLTQCVYGKRFEPWTVILSIYEDDAREMECCGRKLYSRNDVRVIEAGD